MEILCNMGRSGEGGQGRSSLIKCLAGRGPLDTASVVWSHSSLWAVLTDPKPLRASERANLCSGKSTVCMSSHALLSSWITHKSMTSHITLHQWINVQVLEEKYLRKPSFCLLQPDHTFSRLDMEIEKNLLKYIFQHYIFFLRWAIARFQL